MNERQTNGGYAAVPEGKPEGAGTRSSAERWRVTLAQAETTTLPEGKRSAEVLDRGSMLVRLYALRGTDKQGPYTRDELYVVARGSGTFVNTGNATPSERATSCSCRRAGSTASRTSPTTSPRGSSSTARKEGGESPREEDRKGA